MNISIQIGEAAPGFSPSSADLIAGCSAFVAVCAVVVTWLIFAAQRRAEQRRVVAQLHTDWWSQTLAEQRGIVWSQAERWRVEGDNSPAIQHYGRQWDIWDPESAEARAHARVLFFFSDLEVLIAHKIADEALAMHLFGKAQYGWFRDYFDAIIESLRQARRRDPMLPRFVDDLGRFNARMDRWERRLSRRPGRDRLKAHRR